MSASLTRSRSGTASCLAVLGEIELSSARQREVQGGLHDRMRRDPLFTRETTRALLPSSLLRGGRASRVRSHLTESWEGPELTLLGPLDEA